jgi:arabinan endo-1,5-alpha-L-arabinosidase
MATALIMSVILLFAACTEGATEPPVKNGKNSIVVDGEATGSVYMKLSQQNTASASVEFEITYEDGAEQGIVVSFTKNGANHSTGITVTIDGTISATEYGEFVIRVALKADPTEYVVIAATVDKPDHPESLLQPEPSAAAEITYPTNTRTGNMPSAHDPAIVRDPDTGIYYQFATGRSRSKSTDLISWTSMSVYLPNTPSAAVSAGGAQGSIWAPDVIKGNDGKWWLYYSSSTINTNNSVIGLAKADNIEDTFVHDSIIVSTKTNQPPNAIDASVKYDKSTGKLWMSYGSFFGGVFLKELDPDTGCALGSSFGTNLVPAIDVEGSYLIYNEEFEYWYLFMAYGDMNKNYNTRVVRSKTIDGPYLDASGQRILDADKTSSKQYGTKLAGNYNIDGRSWTAIGHNSVLDNTAVDGKWYHLAHQASGSTLHVKQMYFMPNGWPVININEYAGETAGPVNKLNMPGVYNSLFQVAGNLIDDDTLHRPMDLEIKSDGTLSGTVTYDANPTTDSYTVTVEGTWRMRGTNKIEFNFTTAAVTLSVKATEEALYAYDYSGVFNGIVTPSYSYQLQKAVLSFTAMSTTGICFVGNLPNA